MTTHRKICAVFDLDGTLINATSLIEFFPVYLDIVYGTSAKNKVQQFKESLVVKMNDEKNRMHLNRWFYSEFFTGVRIDSIKQAANQWLETKLDDPSFFVSSMIEELNNHRRNGTQCVLLTGSCKEIAMPICDRLNIQDYICAPLEEHTGVYTGNLSCNPTIGIGKQYAITRFATEQNIDLYNSYGYGDDLSDFPYLESMGIPNVVCKVSSPVYAAAADRGWNIFLNGI